MAKEHKNLTAEPAVGTDFSELPKDEQERIVKSIFGVRSEWKFLSKIVKAKPERKLAMLRELKGLTQTELAKAAGIRQADVSIAEKCIDGVKYGTLRKIAKCLDTPLDKILF